MGFYDELCLTPANVELDKGLKQNYKDILNSISGKFSQRPRKEQAKFVHNQESLEGLVNSVEEEVVDVTCHSGDVCEVDVEAIARLRGPSRRSQLVIGAWITAESRIDMHKCMMDLLSSGCELLAHDTDNIMYLIEKNQKTPLKLSYAFGGFKSELPPDQNVIEFSSIAKKSVCLKMRDKSGTESLSIKMKGLSLQSKMTADFTDVKYKGLLEAHVKNGGILTEKVYQQRTRKSGNVMKKNVSKFKVTSSLDYGRYLDTNTLKTHPYGFNYSAPQK